METRRQVQRGLPYYKYLIHASSQHLKVKWMKFNSSFWLNMKIVMGVSLFLQKAAWCEVQHRNPHLHPQPPGFPGDTWRSRTVWVQRRAPRSPAASCRRLTVCWNHCGPRGSAGEAARETAWENAWEVAWEDAWEAAWEDAWENAWEAAWEAPGWRRQERQETKYYWQVFKKHLVITGGWCDFGWFEQCICCDVMFDSRRNERSWSSLNIKIK